LGLVQWLFASLENMPEIRYPYQHGGAMIISASRRTDIPAFYSGWLMKRLEEKKVWVKNPLNAKSITEICLDPEYIECMVFWTKNPKNMLPHLPRIDDLGHRYYFQFTLTPYDDKIERNLEKNDMAATFIALSNMIGKEKVIWRYDPIFINDYYTVEYHTAYFESLCERIGNYTSTCVISFIDSYNFLAENFRDFSITELNGGQINTLVTRMVDIAGKHRITIATCAEKIDLEKYGVQHNKCIDNDLIEKLFGLKVGYKKDTSQRPACGCCASRDIGTYNTCLFDCVYCYANRRKDSANYDPNALLLCGVPNGTEKIHVVKTDKIELR
jgi:hypothetical protein